MVLALLAVRSTCKANILKAGCYLIGDTALYVQETIAHLNELAQLFIIWVPQTLQEAKTLIAQVP